MRFDEAAIVEEHALLVRAMADNLSRIAGQESDLEDLEAHGMEALIHAHRSFDRRRVDSFTTFASSRIRAAMLDALTLIQPIPRGYVEDDPASLEPDPEAQAMVARDGATAFRALAGLPPQERHLLEITYRESTDLAFAGGRLGRSRAWACRLHAKAMTRLRKRLRITPATAKAS